MRADDAQQVAIARDYLAGVEQTDVLHLPPSRLLFEAAESRRQLGILLSVIEETERQAEGRQLAEIRAVLAAFDWEHHDRQTALERIDQIAGER